MNARTTKVSLAALVAMIAAIVLAQAAGAWWTNSGSGGGGATTATMPGASAPAVTPSGTSVTVDVTQISVAGDLIGAVGGGYEVLRQPAGGGSGVTPGGTCGALLTGAASVLSCVETGTPRGDWKYTVRPILYGWSSAASPASATVTIAPDPASSLTATAAPAAAVDLAWSAGAGATGYNVYRRTTIGSYNFAAPVNGGTPVSGTSWTDTTATSGSSYNYVVRSVVIGSLGQQIESTSSNESSAVTADGTVPTGVTLNAVATPMRASITLSGTASDTISGVASVAFQYRPSGGGSWVDGCVDTTTPYSCSFNTASAADGLYDFRALATDGVGNTTASAVQTSRRIDNTAPVATATNPGAFVRGTVSLGGTAVETGSGLSLLDLQGAVVGGTLGSVCTGTTSPLVCSYDTTTLADGSYEVQLVATDNAGNIGTSPMITPIVVDNTAPTVTITNPGANISGTPTLSSTNSDATSGIDTVLYQYKPSAGSTWSTACTGTTTPFSCGFDTTSVTDGLYDFRAIATDRSGNQTTSAAVTSRRIDNTAPTGAAIGTVATNIRGTITITNTGTPADGGSGLAGMAVQYSPAGAGTWTSICTRTATPWNCNFVSTGVADGLYDFRTLVTDNAGNTMSSTVLTDRRVDNTAPVVALDNPGSPLRGTITVSSASTDAGSGVASVLFEQRITGAWTTICTDNTSPYSCSWNTTGLNNTYELRATVTDVAGNTNTQSITGILIDNTAPTTSLTDPGANLRGTVTLAATATDGGSGVQSVVFQRSPAGAGTWTTICTDIATPWNCAWDTTLVADALYDLRVVTTDNAGNATTSAVLTNRRVDNTVPVVALGAIGSPIRATLAMTATASDTGGSGVASVAFQRSPAGSGTWTTISTDPTSAYTASFDTTTVGDGLYDFRALATDNAGNTATSTISSRQIDNTRPSAAGIAIANGGGTLGRPDSGDTITYTFTEPMLSTSVLAGWNGSATAVRVRLRQAGTDALTIRDSTGGTQLPLGSTTIGTPWVTGTANFDATMTMTGNTIVVTMGAQIGGTVATSAATYSPVWTPVATPTDIAGNTMNTTTTTGANARLF
jgi:hypothetical protein